jgi:hypothetical protein
MWGHNWGHVRKSHRKIINKFNDYLSNATPVISAKISYHPQRFYFISIIITFRIKEETWSWALAIATIFATLLSPCSQRVQKLIEKHSEKRNIKVNIFTELMATRSAARLSNEHVRALNMIDLAFYGDIKGSINKRTKSEKKSLMHGKNISLIYVLTVQKVRVVTRCGIKIAIDYL